MREEKENFLILLMILMNLTLEASSYFQCLLALDCKYGSDRKNEAIKYVNESIITKLILTLSLIGMADKHSHNINDLINSAITFKEIFKVNSIAVVQKSKEFKSKLKELDPKFKAIVELRHSMLAHLSKKKISQHSKSSNHPFQEIVFEIVEKAGIKNKKEFKSILNKLVSLYAEIVNYYNSIFEEMQMLKFSVDSNDQKIYKDMLSLLK